LAGSFRELRNRCFAPHTLYIANAYLSIIDTMIPPFTHTTIDKYKIYTACGIIPFDRMYDALWTDDDHGDFEYYNHLQHCVELVSFISRPIYHLSDSMKHTRFLPE
jgi:hypothetical protein